MSPLGNSKRHHAAQGQSEEGHPETNDPRSCMLRSIPNNAWIQQKKKVSCRIWQMVKPLNPLKSVDKDAIWGILMVYTYTYTYHGSKILCICSGSLTPKHLPNQRFYMFYGIKQWWPMLILRSVCPLYIPVTKTLKIPNMFESASAS